MRLALNEAPEFREFVKSRGSSLSNLDELVVVRYLWTNPEATTSELCTALQRGRDAVQRIAASMGKKSLIQSDNGCYRLTDAIRFEITSIFSRLQMPLFTS